MGPCSLAGCIDSCNTSTRPGRTPNAGRRVIFHSRLHKCQSTTAQAALATNDSYVDPGHRPPYGQIAVVHATLENDRPDNLKSQTECCQEERKCILFRHKFCPTTDVHLRYTLMDAGQPRARGTAAASRSATVLRARVSNGKPDRGASGLPKPHRCYAITSLRRSAKSSAVLGLCAVLRRL